MQAFWTNVDDVLRMRGQSVASATDRRSLVTLVAYAAVFGVAYGAAMGSYAGVVGGRPWDELLLQMTYSALKVPLLLGVTCLVSLPSFFILSSLVGLRDDFAASVRAIAATQAGVAIILASLAPLTITWYLSSSAYVPAILFNAAMFALASVAAQQLLRGHYRTLIARDPRHRAMMWTWLGLYAFVGIEMGWMLRPFIGDLGSEVEFVRREPLDNAYVIVARLIWSAVK